MAIPAANNPIPATTPAIIAAGPSKLTQNELAATPAPIKLAFNDNKVGINIPTDVATDTPVEVHAFICSSAVAVSSVKVFIAPLTADIVEIVVPITSIPACKPSLAIANFSVASNWS